MRGVEQHPALYDRIVEPFEQGLLGHWRRQLFGALTGDILELGVGTGLNLRAYDPAARVTGIDVELPLARRAHVRARSRDARVLLGDAQRLPFPDASFDYVTSALVFCSIPDPALALREVARVLRPGGHLVQLEHTRTNRPLPDALLNAITPLWSTIAGGCHPNRDTPALLTQHGWRLMRHERHISGLIRLIEALPPAAGLPDR
ncbi:MAG TPA: methyltransferase domain-containing protein [Herpetosiphonaceae bacterium]